MGITAYYARCGQEIKDFKGEGCLCEDCKKEVRNEDTRREKKETQRY